MDFESLWIINIIIGIISGFLLTLNRYNANLWITAIEIIIILSVIITAIQLIFARNNYESLVSQTFKKFFMNLWQIVAGMLIGLCFTSFIIGLLY